MICEKCEMDTITDEDAIMDGTIVCPNCAKEKKVYCRNCKYALYGKNGSFCSAEYKTSDNKYTGEEGRHYERENLNGNGECPHYVRKLWKFWIK